MTTKYKHLITKVFANRCVPEANRILFVFLSACRITGESIVRLLSGVLQHDMLLPNFDIDPFVFTDYVYGVVILCSNARELCMCKLYIYRQRNIKFVRLHIK
jgi:hypothetical protein